METGRASMASSGSANAELVKLPRINIVQFHGKPQEYVTWAAQVKAHVLEQDLAPVAKFVYLERSAQGDVKTLVKRYQTMPTVESLEKCLEEIRARYRNPKLRMRAALDRFQRKDNRPGYKESRCLLDSARASLTRLNSENWAKFGKDVILAEDVTLTRPSPTSLETTNCTSNLCPKVANC